MPNVQCIECNKEFNVVPARLATAKFCSYACRGRWRTKHWIGASNPAFDQSEPREKPCQHCGVTMRQHELSGSIATFRVRKFCSRECAKLGQKRHYGEDHPLYKPDSRRKNRRGQHGAWARAVISRDEATCRHCGAVGVQLHAHHIKPFAEYPELRWDVSNGITLCYQCHWTVHAASNANGVNSGNILPGKAGDNPEPSFGRKPIEGVTTRGRAYRRWDGACDECGTFISKAWSDTVGKANLFCSRRCAARFKGRHQAGKPRKKRPSEMAVISSTSAPPERDDIV